MDQPSDQERRHRARLLLLDRRGLHLSGRRPGRRQHGWRQQCRRQPWLPAGGGSGLVRQPGVEEPGAEHQERRLLVRPCRRCTQHPGRPSADPDRRRRCRQRHTRYQRRRGGGSRRYRERQRWQRSHRQRTEQRHRRRRQAGNRSGHHFRQPERHRRDHFGQRCGRDGPLRHADPWCRWQLPLRGQRHQCAGAGPANCQRYIGRYLHLPHDRCLRRDLHHHPQRDHPGCQRCAGGQG